MSDDTNINNDQSVDTGSVNDNVEVDTKVSDIEAQIVALTEELNQTKANLDKSRKAEKHAKTVKDQAFELAKSEVSTQYEETIKQLTEKVNQYEEKDYQTKLDTALAAVGAIDSKALSKIIGKVANVDEAIQAAINDYPSLFTQTQTTNVLPQLSRSVEGVKATTHQTEIRAALDRRDYASIPFINAKYGVRVQ